MRPSALVDRLGDRDLAELVRVEVVGALTSACDDASVAHESSRYSDGFTYGTTRWRYGLGWVADTLLAKAAGEVVKFGHLRLALIGGQPGALVYPIAVGKTAKLDPQALQIKPSRLRQALFSSPQRAHQLMFDYDDADTGDAEVQLDDKVASSSGQSSDTRQTSAVSEMPDVAAYPEEADEAELEDAEVGDADLTGARSAGRAVLLLVYTSNPTNGLLAAVIGEAVMSEDGTLTFGWCEQLQVRGDGGDGGLRLVGPSSPKGPDFTTGDEPKIVTPPRRTPEQAVAGARARSGDGSVGSPGEGH